MRAFKSGRQDVPQVAVAVVDVVGGRCVAACPGGATYGPAQEVFVYTHCHAVLVYILRNFELSGSIVSVKAHAVAFDDIARTAVCVAVVGEDAPPCGFACIVPRITGLGGCDGYGRRRGLV